MYWLKEKTLFVKKISFQPFCENLLHYHKIHLVDIGICSNFSDNLLQQKMNLEPDRISGFSILLLDF